MAWDYQGAFYSGWQNDMRVEVRYYFGDQSIENNTTQILSETYLQTRNGRWIDSNFTGASLANSWGGSQTKQHYNNGNQTTYFTGYSQTVTHNADGVKSVQFGGRLKENLGVLAFDQTVSEWHLLPTIPRATTPTLSGGGGFTTGAVRTISLPRASSNFTHDVTYSFRGLSGTIATGAGVSTSWTPPHNLMEALTNGTSANVTITVVTKQGSTVIGTRSAQFSLTAAASIVPTVSQVLWDDNNPVVKTNIGAFVQGLSLIKGAVTAAGVYGSTITERRLRIGSTILPEGTPIQIAGSGTVTAQGEAVDSRGRLGTASANFNVLPYQPPRLGSGGWQIRRANSAGTPDDNGQYLRLDLHALVNSLEVASVEKNALTVSVRTRPVGGAWTNRNTISPGLSYNSHVLITGGATYLTSQSYEVEVTLTDRTGSEPTRMSTTVATAAVTLDLDGNSVGVGKYRERGTLDVGGDGYATNWRADEGVYAGGAILSPVGSMVEWPAATAPQGWLLARGQAVSRTTYAELFALIGTTYGSGNGSSTFNLPDMRGRVPVGMNTAETEFNALGKTYGTKTHTLTTAEMPAHTHSASNNSGHYVYGGSSQGAGFQGTGFRSQMTAVTTGSAGSGNAHNNVQPSIALNYIIRAL